MYSAKFSSLALSRTMLPTAAYTVALGVHANPIYAFSLNVNFPEGVVQITTASHLAHSPSIITKKETTIVLG